MAMLRKHGYDKQIEEQWACQRFTVLQSSLKAGWWDSSQVLQSHFCDTCKVRHIRDAHIAQQHWMRLRYDQSARFYADFNKRQRGRVLPAVIGMSYDDFIKKPQQYRSYIMEATWKDQKFSWGEYDYKGDLWRICVRQWIFRENGHWGNSKRYGKKAASAEAGHRLALLEHANIAYKRRAKELG